VSKSSLRLALSTSILDDIVAPFERAFGLSGTVVICDEYHAALYGRLPEDRNAYHTDVIRVDNQIVGSVEVYQDLPDLPEKVRYLAATLSHLATETWRRQLLADEVLARYNELNLIYELGMNFVQGTTPDVIVSVVLAETNRIMKADAGVIYVWDGNRSTIMPVSFFGNKASPDFWGGRVRELALSTLYAYEQAQLFEGDQVICAPLRFNEELIGALVLLYEHADKRFRANDVNLLTTLSQNTALFIYAAQLVERLAQEKVNLEGTLKELQATKDKLSHAERLSLVGQTVSSLVHDMRKPLSNVMGYAGLLQEPDLSDEERHQFADQIIKYIEVFSAMAQEVLDYTSGDDNLHPTPISVEKYMAYVSDLLNPPGLERTVKLIVNSEPAHGYTIKVDTQRFTRVFQNLVNNAFDVLEQKGGSQVEISVQPVDNTVQFTVTDDGPGVPEQIRATLFEPFVTMGKSHGTGLGLAIVDRMVKLHGGQIHYETAPGGGARFIFSVPQVKNGRH
jgi:signal transduction histidine kinase